MSTSINVQFGIVDGLNVLLLLRLLSALRHSNAVKETKREHIRVDLLKVFFNGWYIRNILTKFTELVDQKICYLFAVSYSHHRSNFLKREFLFQF